MKIRELVENDYENYLILINQFRKTNFSKEDFIEKLKKIKSNSNIFVIEHDNILIGTGTLLYETKFIYNICKLAHIEDICIHNEYRQYGYGKLLIKYLIEEAKKQNCYKVTLYCEDSLEGFYKSNGLEKRGIMMNKYFDNHN